METGLKNIEDVRIGDMVLSWNEKTGEREYKEVTELFLHEVELLYEVRIQRPLDGSLASLVDETILETTWNHPFWVVDKKAWAEVRDLNVGDRVLLIDGKEVAISGIRSYNVEATKVYNFEVADNHTYFVGEDGVLVHNYAFVIPVIGAGIMKCAQNAACSRAVATGTAVLGTAISGVFSGNTVHRAEGEDESDKQKKGRPKTNTVQNKQVDDAIKDAGGSLKDKKLREKIRNEIHERSRNLRENLTKRDLDEIVRDAIEGNL